MESKRKQIGIMGGTFNPIHYGHLMVAEHARIFFHLDEIIFIPSGNSYMKDAGEIISGNHRFIMTQLAIESNPNFSVSDMEINRQGHSYTYETLKILKEDQPDTDFYFILGADNLFSVEKWKYVEQIMQNCTLIVAARGKKSEEELNKQAEHLFHKYNAKILILPEKKFDISSTDIRNNIKNNVSVFYMTPQNVISYITENNLYH